MEFMPNLDTLQPASKADVGIYTPYYQKDTLNVLPYAISLYQQGNLEGNRQIEGSEQIPFVASWYISKLPSELTRCRIQFDGQADLSYEITILNWEFINLLVSVIKGFKQFGVADFPQVFYRKLLRFEE